VKLKIAKPAMLRRSNRPQLVLACSKNARFFEETIGTWMCQPKPEPQGFDFEAKRKRHFSFCVRANKPHGIFKGFLLLVQLCKSSDTVLQSLRKRHQKALRFF
jgi:hypothetical protein